MFSSEATGGCSTFRFLETGRGGIIELYWYKETCTCSDPKNRVSKHEVHKPPIHDEGLSFLTKLGITAGDLGSPVHPGNDDKGQGDLTRTKGTCASSNSKREEFRNMKFTNRGDVEANLTDPGTDRDAIGGDPCIRQQCRARNIHQDGIREGTTSFNQRVVDTRIVSQERVPVGVGRHIAELGGHWNDRTHVRTSDVVAVADATAPWRGAETGVGMSRQVQ